MTRKEYMKLYNKRYYLKNRERELARCKEYGKENRKQVSIREKIYRDDHRERYRKHDLAWRSKPFNRELTRINAHIQEFKKSSVVSITSKDIVDLLNNMEEANNGILVCNYCNEVIDRYAPYSFHIEHKIPICRGGTTTLDNVCIACPECNISKGKQTEEEFVA